MVMNVGHEIDLKKYEIRTDLVLDTIENNSSDIDKHVNSYGSIKVTKVNVDSESSILLNKKEGNYVTIEFKDVTDTENRNKLEDIFVKEFREILKDIGIKDDDVCLVVGLGNKDSTPDSLGPKVIKNILVTSHLFALKEDVSKGIRSVSAISPGVMANTGIETVDIITSIIRMFNPSFVIAIDALAASSIDRINKSIQITDTGIHPGSGVGNQRKEISFSSVGVPVIAIGVPTVVESSIIVYDTIEYLFKHISYIKDNANKNKFIFNRHNYLEKIKDRNLSLADKKNVSGLLGELSEQDRHALIYEVLNSLDYNFIVTPKEIDFLIDKLSNVLSCGINKALHNGEVSN